MRITESGLPAKTLIEFNFIANIFSHVRMYVCMCVMMSQNANFDNEKIQQISERFSTLTFVTYEEYSW